jgi:alanine racemase
MLQLLRRLLKRRNAPLNIFHISKGAILHNIDTLRLLHPHDGLFPVIKSNAYGHGLAQIAEILDETDCEYLCIDSQPEYAIAKKHTKKDFLVLSETNTHNYKLYDWKRTTFVISSFSTLSYFIEKKKPVTVHIFINT